MRRASDAESETGLGLVAVVGKRADRYVTRVLTAVDPDTRGGGNRGLASAIAVVGVVDTHSRIGCCREPLEFFGEGDLVGRGIRSQGLVPQFLRHYGDAIGFGEAGPFVGGTERHVVACLRQHRGNR